MPPLGARIDTGQVVSTEVEPFPPLLPLRSGHGSANGLANKGRIAPYLRSLL